VRLVVACLLVLLISASVAAQAPSGPSPGSSAVDDKTGSNPLNFQQQADATTTYLTRDGYYLATATYRHGITLFDRRVRISASLPFGRTDVTGAEVRGLSDVGSDVEWLPWRARRGGLVVGLRSTWDTAVDGLGLGTNTLLPYVQWVSHVSPSVTMAPWVGRRTSAGGGDDAFAFNETMLGLSVIWRPSGRSWMSAQPHLLLDHEAGTRFGDVGGEVGYLLTRHLSVYGRPSFGYGPANAKPYAWGVTGGIRWVR
jgi:hypothetical protein